jgi:predicted DNA binding protein
MKDLWREPYHVVLEVENRECSILKRLASLEIKKFKVRDIRSSNSITVKHLIELDMEEALKVRSEVSELKNKNFKNMLRGKPSVWFESKGCKICKTILSSDAFLVSGKSLTDYVIMYSFMVPSFDSYQQIVAAMEGEGLKVNVLKMGRFEPRSDLLTERQERIFWLALKGGFFDYPRKIDTSELSAKLGISPSTLSEITRRGMRRLLENYFKEEAAKS